MQQKRLAASYEDGMLLQTHSLKAEDMNSVLVECGEIVPESDPVSNFVEFSVEYLLLLFRFGLRAVY